ncbi:MAG: helix-turn-helix domain-containing protein [Bacteriovoracia bacterium]
MGKNSGVSGRYFESVGAYLREMRVNAGLTQKYVADELGYSTPQFVSNFERGVALPSLKKMKVLIRLYNLSIPEFIRLVLEAERKRMADGLTRDKKRASR